MLEISSLVPRERLLYFANLLEIIKTNMKKISLLVVGLFLVISLSGCGKPANDGKIVGENDSLSNSNYPIPEVQNQEGAEVKDEIAGDGVGMIEQLKNAISSGKKMKCTYKTGEENGATDVVTYIQGDKYKTEVVLGEMTTTSVFDGEIMYSWVAGQKVGTKMAMDCIDSLDIKGETEIPQENVPLEDGEGFVEKLSSTQNLSCEDAADIDFSIPTDVNFSDQCEMLKTQQKMIEGLNQ